MLMSLTILTPFCLPFKRSHFPFVALQAAAGMGVFGPRTVYCIAMRMPLDPDVSCHSKFLLFALQDITCPLCCPSGSSWNGSVWAHSCLLHCIDGCPFPCHSKLLLFAHQEIMLSLCCPSGSSWNGSVWAQNRILHCLEGCPRVP